jgi:hypothetical protein
MNSNQIDEILRIDQDFQREKSQIKQRHEKAYQKKVRNLEQEIGQLKQKLLQDNFTTPATSPKDIAKTESEALKKIKESFERNRTKAQKKIIQHLEIILKPQ